MHTIHDKVTPAQLDDLYHRRVTARKLAKDLGYSEWWVRRALPARAPRRDEKELKRTRKAFQNQVLERYTDNQLSSKQAAEQIFASLRTFFRRLKAYKNAQP